MRWLDLRMQRMFICTAAPVCMMCHMMTMMWKLSQIDYCNITDQWGPIGMQTWAPFGEADVKITIVYTSP